MRGTAAVMMMVLVVACLYALYEWAIFRSMEASIGEGSPGFFSPPVALVIFSLYWYLF